MPSARIPQPPQKFSISTVLILCLVGVFLYFFSEYLFDSRNYKEGNTAFNQNNCPVAVEQFNQIINKWRMFDLFGYQSLAQKQRKECLTLLAATEQEKVGNISQALVNYNIVIYENSQAGKLREIASDRFNAILAKYNPSAIVSSQFCDDVTKIESLLTSENSLKLPSFYLACGEKYTNLKAYEQANKLFETFLNKYPKHSLIPQVKAAWAKTLVAQASEQGAGDLPTPQRSGFFND